MTQKIAPMHSEKSYRYLIRRVLALMLPMAWSRFIQMIGWFAGMLMVAHLGKVELAASALINATQITVTVIFMALFFANGVIAGRLYGEESPKEVGILFQQSCFLGFIIGCITVFVFYYISRLLTWSDQAPELVAVVDMYFKAFAWAAIPFMILISLQQFCYGIMQQNLVIYNNMLSLLLFIPITYLFIYGGWGIKPMGVVGLAYGILVQNLFNLLTLLGSLALTPSAKIYQIFKRHHQQGFRYVKAIFSIGWPMMVQFGGELLAFFVITLFTGWLGIAALAATQITLQVALLFLVPLFAVSESAGILVSQSVGANCIDEVEHITKICLIFGLSFVVIFSILFFAIPDHLTAMYIDIHSASNQLTVKLSRWLFYLTALMLLTDMLRNLYTGALRGFYDTQFPMWIGLFALWIVSVPLSYIFGFWLNAGVVGVRAGAIVGIILGAIILWRRWHYKVDQAQKRIPLSGLKESK